MSNIIFLKPLYFILSLLPIILLWWPSKKNNQLAINIPFATDILKCYQKNLYKSQINYKKFFILYLVWLALVSALAQPNLLKNNQKTYHFGYDLMLAVDVSGSMAALDFSSKDELLNRLQVTQAILTEFIAERNNDRIGIIIFGKFAYLESPLTIDNITLTNVINNLEIGIAGKDTAIGDALTLAVKKLKDQPAASKAIILLTDGENTAGQIAPLTAAELAKKYEIPVYTIGIGKNGEAPFIDQFGRLQYGRVFLDEVTLQEIAQLTNAKFFRAENKTELKKIYAEIDKLTATKAEHKSYLEYHSLFQYPLILAMLILLCYVLYFKKITKCVKHV